MSDSGPGIPSDQLPTLFDPFVMGPGEGAEEGRGFGLGLAISRELARGMGGDLTVESEIGRGSTFTLALPRA